MSVWEAAVLGVVQGATEFLPVSSSGHLVIGQSVLGINMPGVVFEVSVHLATAISILFAYRSRVAKLLVGALRLDARALRYLALLVVASLPAGIAGTLGGSFFEALFEAPAVVGVALLMTGGVLWTSRRVLTSATDPLPGWGGALLIGIAQAFAIVPGVSRSGATVVAALWSGVEAREAAAFSFLMAVPAIVGAALIQLPQMGNVGGPSWLLLGVGALTAGITGVLAIRTFVAMLGNRSFFLFAPYCWLAGGIFLFYLMLS